MCTEPTTAALTAGRTSDYGPREWIALAGAALDEAAAGIRDDSALTGPEALELVSGIQVLGERFPDVVSDLANALMAAHRDIVWAEQADFMQFMGGSSALFGAAAGFSRGGGWLDYAHTCLTGFRVQHADEVGTVTEPAAG